MSKVLPFGAWLMKQGDARKINRGKEWGLASYFRNDPNREYIKTMDVAEFVVYLSGWTAFNAEFRLAHEAYQEYVLGRLSQLQQ